VSGHRDVALRRLAAGVLLPGFTGTAPPPWLAEAIEGGLAGVVYYAPNIASPGQVARLSRRLHRLREGVLIAADEEGGDVTRLRAATGSDVPGNAALGEVDDVALTEAVAGAIGRELRLAGVDVDLAPCVDVNCEPANPVIGVRSFGATPAVVGRHGAAAVRGLQAAGIAACAKHFPGHGATRLDSHLALPAVRADAATLWARELPPFAAAIEAGVRCVLTAHVLVPALDAGRPATLSPVLLGLLRAELGFDGVVVTDAMDMAAIAGTVGVAAGAVAALAAGADLVCLGNPANDAARGDGGAELRSVWQAVVDAVRSRELPVARLEQAAERVRSLAGWCRAAGALPPPAAAPGVGLAAARRAVRVTGRVRLAGWPEVVDLRRLLNRAAGRNSAALPAELRRRAPGNAGSPGAAPGVEPGRLGVEPGPGADPGWPGGGPGPSDDGRCSSSAGRGLVILVDEPHRDLAVLAELRALLAGRPDAVVIATGWPVPDVDLGPNVVRTFGNGRVNAAAAAEVIFGPAGVTAGISDTGS
jgi:beta-N-acetylhexosaminidase